jgi:hypothetical protein
MTDQVPADAGAQPIADANSIDTIIDEAVAETPEKPIEPEEVKPDEPFPKKAVNALSRKDKQIGKLRAQYEQAQLELNQLRQKAPLPKTDGAPKESDYQNYADYLEARQDYKLEQKLTERDGKQNKTQQDFQEQAWFSQRSIEVKAQSDKMAQEIPDYTAVFEEFGDVVDEYSPQLQRFFLEADNAPLAFYNLAKEGKLEELAHMSLAKAAMEIGRAQTQAYTKQKTKAPAPLPASRGSVSQGKKLDDMNGTELRSWMRAET